MDYLRMKDWMKVISLLSIVESYYLKKMANYVKLNIQKMGIKATTYTFVENTG